MAEPKKTAQGTWRVMIEVRGVRDSKTVHKAGNLASLERVALPAAAWFSGAM
jgi:hypothetical protein